MPSLYDLIDRIFTLFEDALQAAFVSDFIMGKHLEAGFVVGYTKFTGGSLTFQLRCIAFRLVFVLIVHKFYKSQAGGFFAYNILHKVSTKVEESQSVNALAAGKIYRPLKEGQIRLVRLHSHRYEGTEPGDDNDNKISCSLFNVSLDDHPTPEYEAVSYVWGSHSDLKAIQLDQECFWVTRNLAAALKVFRLPDRDRIFWIDALAINQSSFAERADQVKRMPRIYSSARDTLVWLNDDNVREIESNPLWMYLCSRKGRHQTEGLPPTQKSQQIWDWGHLSSLWSGLSDLQYWHRVWTAQEVVHSQQASLVTPSSSIPFGVLDDLLAPEVVEGHPETRALESSMKTFQKTCLTLRPDTISSGSWINLDTWIQMCIFRNCYDPRDYVFGLSGCFPPEVRQTVRIDYFLDSDNVLKEATLAFLRHEGCLDYLRHSNCFGQESRWINGLPSWVPTFMLERCKTLLGHDIGRVPHPSTLGSERTPVFLEALEESRVLHVRGRWIGQVEKVDTGLQAHPLGKTREARALRLVRRLKFALFLLDVRYGELYEFCHALRGAESDITAGDLSALPTILTQRAPLRAEQEQYDRFVVSKYQEDWGEEALLDTYTEVTMVRVKDQRGARAAFGITWGDGQNVKSGDEICLLEGCSHALILRAESTSRWKLWKRHSQGQHRIIGTTVLRGGGSKEQDWFEEIRLGVDLDDIFLS